MVYLIHFTSPLAHARHYIGFTETGKPGGLMARLERHRKGRGSSLMAAVHAAGISICVARVWPEGTRDFERWLKRQKNAAVFCVRCRQYPRAIDPTRITMRMKEGTISAAPDTGRLHPARVEARCAAGDCGMCR